MAEDQSYFVFTCQRCLQPLKLQDSLGSLGEHILAELSLPIQSLPTIDLGSEATSFDNYIHPGPLSDSANVANGFTLILNGVETESRVNRNEVKATLFDTISGNSYIDHPLCDECADSMLEMLDNEMQLTERDYQDYCDYFKSLEKDRVEPNLVELEKQLEDLKNEEQQLMNELDDLCQEEVATLEAIKEQEKLGEQLSIDEDKYWTDYAKIRWEAMSLDDELDSLDRQLKYSENQLGKLKKMNVFNATFHIWHSGHFGTINNFRLGRLPTAAVDWSEINAAWGQTALLLTALARKVDITFTKYRIVPYGNHSYIEVLDEQKELPLYGSGGFRFLWDTKLDAAMVAFLDCMQQFRTKVHEKGYKDFSLPYKMTKGKIEDANTSYSIKIQFNSEEQWTKALKFMLTNLKWTLAWVTSLFKKEEEDAAAKAVAIPSGEGPSGISK